MGITFQNIANFFDSGYIDNPHARVLDVGCSNIHSINAELAYWFIKTRNDIYDEESLRVWARYFAAGGVMHPKLGGINGAWLGDLLQRAGMLYKAYDIFPGYQTQVFDLNLQSIPREEIGSYDVVFNFGTTEHVLGQYNAFKVIHDAVRVGGVIYHELPMTGHLNHGFFNYNPVMLLSIAEANRYEILWLGFSGGAEGETISTRLAPYYRGCAYFHPIPEISDWADATIPTSAITLIVRKMVDAPFRAALETTTTVGSVPEEIARAYGSADAEHTISQATLLEWKTTILRRIRDPQLTLHELWEYYNAFVSAGINENFSYTIELRMLDQELQIHQGDGQLITRRAVVQDLLRRTFPLLKAVDANADEGLGTDQLAFDGREDAFDWSGSEDVQFARIIAAYRAYWNESAVDLFPAEIEAVALEYLARKVSSDDDLLLRLGKVMAVVTPNIKLKERKEEGAKAQGKEEEGAKVQRKLAEVVEAADDMERSPDIRQMLLSGALKMADPGTKRAAMDEREKAVLKAACLRAAAILLAPMQRKAEYSFPPGARSAPDTAQCIKYARDLFGKVTSEPWD